jgi:hypothetical protein
MYKENKIKIPKDMAGLMLSGILSDTLILNSPTTTIIDKEAVNVLTKIAGVDYKLPKEITMYYASGFNVFLNDQEYRAKHYTKKYLRYSKLINYRQLGISSNIKHPMLKDELAPVVAMITSDNCDTEAIERLIGQLRFL